MEDDLSPRLVAEDLGVSVRTVQRWIESGRLPARRIGGRLRVSRSSLPGVAAMAGAGSRPTERPIGTLLIANRGEIAVRLARTARRLGVRPVGIHAAGERVPTGVDEAHRIGSYLDGDELLRVARAAGADALHPGYGFLAESPAFARAVVEAGIVWVGPPARAIEAMGDKAEARRTVEAHDVPVAPGYDGDDQADESLAREAERIGFPLLVKPSAGGGGKGMRLIHTAAQLHDALGAARREARGAFGDDRLILERYVEGGRHVEVQVLFDGGGNGVHLGERDCSTQRRNQKVIEEAPAPSVTPQLRERMGSAALRAAASVGYVNAGTVEFLLTDDGTFAFLEMNTRLQVEHPVTEAVTGRDIVADQLAIAAGASLAELGLGHPPRIRGHAIEARLYAEEPEAGFLPSTGKLVHLTWPDGIRVDAGVEAGDVVSDRYDPLLAKLVAHGRTRDAALARLASALAETEVLGVKTNLRFLRWLIDQEPMRRGEMRTTTLGAMTLPDPPAVPDAAWQAAGALLAEAPRDDVWASGWRLNGPAVVRLRAGGETRRVEVGRAPPEVVLAVDGSTAHVDVDGQSVAIEIEPAPAVDEAARHAVAGGDGVAALLAPMPGRVIDISVPAGERVQAGATVLVLEAMKMEHAIVAPTDGIVAHVHVTIGAQVGRGDLLAEVHPYHAEVSER